MVVLKKVASKSPTSTFGPFDTIEAARQFVMSDFKKEKLAEVERHSFWSEDELMKESSISMAPKMLVFQSASDRYTWTIA